MTTKIRKTPRSQKTQQGPVLPVRCAHDELVALSRLKPHPRNPNRHNAKQIALLAKILQAQGWRLPIVVSKRSGLIVAGHARLAAAQSLGVANGPVNFQEFDSDEQELAHLVADNKIAELADTDDATLKALIKDLGNTPLDLELLGLGDELQDILASLNPTAPDDEHATELLSKAAELNRKWKVKKGQLWQLGDHRLLCADALDPASWSRLGAPFDLCFADPPYELALSAASFRQWTRRDLLLMATDKLFLNQSADGFREFFCYTFTSAGVAPWTTTPMRQHTLIGWWRWRECKTDFKGLGTVYAKEGGNQEAGKKHGQAKPVALPESFLRYFTREKETFADAFAGSGSTLMAAQNLKRQARSVELAPENCAVILQRWSDATKRQPKLAGRGTGE